MCDEDGVCEELSVNPSTRFFTKLKQIIGHVSAEGILKTKCHEVVSFSHGAFILLSIITCNIA